MAESATKTKGILLEAGTNELELLVFTCGGVAFGINVAKVKEIIRSVGKYDAGKCILPADFKWQNG